MFTDAQRATARKKIFALGRLKKGQMNKLEEKYELVLRARLQVGEILWYKFHGVKLRLADNTFFETDFAVMQSSGLMEVHEVKGYMLGDARSKLDVAASLYPFRFLLVREVPKKDGGGWSYEEF
jgi:hypothetical protein